MAALVTLPKFKRAVGETGSANDDRLQEALDDASVIVINYAERNFAAEPVTEDRSYAYDGRGTLEIDDCRAVNTVTGLANSSWRARTEGVSHDMITYLELPPFNSNASAEMGFETNLDRLLGAGAGLSPLEVTMTVNADWGWTAVPLDVQRAVIWTAQDIAKDALEGGELASESVAEVARSYMQTQQNQGTDSADALPKRAQGLLDNYRRYSL